MPKQITLDAASETADLTITFRLKAGYTTPITADDVEAVLTFKVTEDGYESERTESVVMTADEVLYGGSRTPQELLLYLRDIRRHGVDLTGY